MADVTTVLATHPNRKQYIYFYIPTSREGLKFHDDWDQLGLPPGRLGNDHVRQRAHLFKRNSAVDARWRADGSRAVLDHVRCVYYSAINIGSSLAVLEHAKNYSRTQRRQSLYPPNVDSATNDPLIQTQYGELLIKVQAAQALFERSSANCRSAGTAAP